MEKATIDLPSCTNFNTSVQCACVLCDEVFDITTKELLQELLKHLLLHHKLVIDNVHLIVDFPRYACCIIMF